MDIDMDKYPMNQMYHENGHRVIDPDDPRVITIAPKKDRGEPATWKEALYNFTQNTTLHGIRFIFMENVSILRRLIWLAVFLVCSGMMGIQIVERIVYYYGYPVTVNVHVNFNNTLTFPAITLCNQNAFRATASTDRQLYRLFEDIYASNGHIPGPEILSNYSVSDTPVQDLYLWTTHKKEDLIVGCEWQSTPCGPENFTQVLTDHGVCFNFNEDLNKPLTVSSTGSDFGLKLTLNVEQYEYMPGPHDAAGVKILLHDQREFPKVAELGLAIPTGTHTYVGIQLLRIQNLPEPHGSCRSQDSPYYSRYSPEACQLACMTTRLEELCGCRHMYMPHVDGDPPICTVEQFLACYVPNIAGVKVYVRDNCQCPVPCDFLLYDPTISFASTSEYATDRLLATASSEKLEEKFIHALETTSRMDRLKFNHFVDLASDMRSRYGTLREVIDKDVRARLQLQTDTLAAVYQEMKEVWENKIYLVKWQKYHVDKNFVRARQAMEERTLFALALGFQEFGYQIDARIWQISHGPLPPEDDVTVSDDVRTGLYLDTLNLIDGRIDLAERAHQNYTQLFGAFYNGTPIFRYKYEKELRDNNIHVTPRPLLREATYHNSYAAKYSVRLGKDINNVKKALMIYRDLLDKSYTYGNITYEEIHKNNVYFMSRCRTFYSSKSSFYTETIEYPSRILAERIADLERRWRNFQHEFDSINDKVTQLTSNMHYLQDTILGSLETTVAEGERYINHAYNSSYNISKMAVARSLTSDKILRGINELENFFDSIRSRGQNVFDGWSALNASTSDIWRVVLEDKDLREYYEYFNRTDMLRNLTVVVSEVATNYTLHRDNCDFRFELGNLDSLFLMSLEKMIEAMKDFIAGSLLDKDFIKRNFLQLDIYYKEKSYEQITQQEAYDLFALMCDIGGSMGLFVGASVLTVCELLDLGLHNSIHRLTHRVRG